MTDIVGWKWCLRCETWSHEFSRLEFSQIFSNFFMFLRVMSGWIENKLEQIMIVLCCHALLSFLLQRHARKLLPRRYTTPLYLYYNDTGWSVIRDKKWVFRVFFERVNGSINNTTDNFTNMKKFVSLC